MKKQQKCGTETEPTFKQLQQLFISSFKRPIIPFSTTGFSCPNCNATYNDKALVSRTRVVFVQVPDPHYSWTETYLCQKCETLYKINNGT